MKKTALLALSLIALFGMSSCTREELPVAEQEKVRKVDFTAHMSEDVDLLTRTGVKLKLIHTWINTKPENVHLFEKDNNKGNILEGSDVTIDTQDPWETATFSAGFYTTIEVNPGTKASIAPMAVKSYTYTGIIAQQNAASKKYFIPEIQYPQADSWIDPDADFIIGKQFVSYETLNEKPVDFSFRRPVAVSRLAITNIEGTYIKSVTINSNSELTGSADYFDIDFDACTVDFSEGASSIKMIFAEGTKKSGTTYANFVCSTGAKEITDVIIETDEYIYTKHVNKSTTFTNTTFLNIAMDMTLKEGECERVNNTKQPLRFLKGETRISADTYDIASEDAYVAPEFTGAAEGAEVTFSSDNETVATVENVEGVLVVSPLATGEAVITATASAVGDFEETSISYTLTVSDSREPQDQVLQFSGTEFDYTYDAETEFVEPELTGAFTKVTYSAEPSTVAIVDEETGNLTFTGTAGTVTVTATAEEGTLGDVKYNEGSASYTVTVTVPTQSVSYYKAAIAEPGYSYLVVSEGNALKTGTSGEAAEYEAVTVTNDVIELEDASALLWELAEASEPAENARFTLKNGEIYAYRSSGDIKLTNDSSKSNRAFDYDGSYLTSKGSSSTYTVYFDNAWVASSDTKKNTVLFTARQPQTVTFTSTPGASVDMAETTSFTFAASASTDVTFSSSNESAAEVNPTTGVVTFKKAASSVTITATAAGSSTYQSASAEYTFAITNSAVTDVVLNLVTSVKDGGTYVMVNEGKALKNDNKAMAAVDVTVSEDKSTVSIGSDVNLDNLVWTWTSSSVNTKYGSYTVTNNGAYLRVSGDYDSGAVNNGYYPSFADYDDANGKYFVWNYSDNYVTSGSSAVRYLTYDNGWTTPNDGTDVPSTATNTYLYEYVDPRAAQTVTFTDYPEGKTHDMAGTNTTFTVVASAQTAVTYSVDDATIATVNSTSGLVTCLKKGTVQITATAAGNDTYKPASASIEIEVTNSDIKEVVLKSVSSVTSGKKYVIVNNGMALRNNNKTIAAVAVTLNSDKSELTINPDDLADITWTWTTSSTSSSYGTYILTNNNSCLYFSKSGSGSSATYTLSIDSYNSSQNDYSVWKFSDNQILNGGSYSKRYLRYSDGWTYNSSSSSSYKSYLYEVTE